jgi:hypothetical protein
MMLFLLTKQQQKLKNKFGKYDKSSKQKKIPTRI